MLSLKTCISIGHRDNSIQRERERKKERKKEKKRKKERKKEQTYT